MVKPRERLGNYEVATADDGSPMMLGSGTGGVTYLGRHIHLGTEVAIKVLIRRKNLLQKDRDAFLSEARSAASLAHPQIARILDFGESGQQHPYYVMELCEGGSLEEFGRKLTPPDEYACIQWFFESASALAYAHQKGILHRDIKPSNLLIARQNDFASVKLIDFGLADHADQMEAAQQVIGTPHFAAPEQLRGHAEPASDVFSLGATFLWLMTGKNLSQGDVQAVISERLEASSYNSLIASLPAGWKNLLQRMLEIDPTLRARDGSDVLASLQAAFPNHPGHPVPWASSEEFPGASSSAPAPSLWQDLPESSWPDRWTEVKPPVAIAYGLSFQASRPDNSKLYDVCKFTNLSPEIADVLTKQADLMARYSAELGLDEVILERSENCQTVAWPALASNDALSWVRQGQSASIPEILAALTPIALALDGMKPGGFEHMELHPSMLVVHDGPPLGFSLAVSLPVYIDQEHPSDSAGTMRGAMGAGLTARFASCVYQLLSGRTPAPAAFVNARAYQAIPKLTERSNRFLSAAIAGTHAGGTCQDVIRGLAHEERIPGASLSGDTAASRTAASWRSSPGMTMPVAPVPVVPQQKSNLTIGQAVVVSSTLRAEEISTPQKTPTLGLPLKSKKPFIALAVAVCIVVIVAAGFAFSKSRKAIPQIHSTSPSKVDPVVNTSIPTPTPSPPDTAETLSIVKVPGDATTIAAALDRCESGGTIEIIGGNYAEALIISKSVSIISKTAVVFEDGGLASSIITARGPIQVTLRNIQFKNTQRQVDTALESSPSLILISDGANVHFEGCVIEGSVGNGVSLADKASATFSNCRIRRNRGYGINITSASKVEARLSEIQENGRSGIAVSNLGSIVTLASGATISANSLNGVEVANGAELNCSSAEINANQKVGLIVEGSGSLARLESSCVISGNRKFGAGITNSGRLLLSDSTVENNSENGIYVESGGQTEISGSRFKSNGTIGVYLVGGTESAVTISKSEFESHSDAGVAFVEGTGKVSDSRFSQNPMAIFYGNGSSGSAIGNVIRPGPLESALVTENAREVTFKDNTVEGEH